MNASWLFSRVWPAKLTNYSVHSNWEIKIINNIPVNVCTTSFAVVALKIYHYYTVSNNLSFQFTANWFLDHLFNAIVLPNFSFADLPVYGASDSDLSVIQNFLDRCMKRKFMSKNVNIRDLLEKADRTLSKNRSNCPECPFFQFLPKEKNMRYTLRNTSISVPRIYTDRFKNVFSDRIIFRYDM